MKRTIHSIYCIVALFLCRNLTAFANTVEFAHVFVPDKANGAAYDRTRYEQTWGNFSATYPKDIPGYGIDQKITDGRIVYNGNRYRMPFLSGYDHIVGIAGHLTDMLDRVEIVVNGNIVRTIRKSALIYSGATKRDNPDSRDPERKGLVVFKVNRADLPSLNEDFQLRIRFAVEVAGFDKLDCKVVHGSSQIKSIQWTTNNSAQLPDIIETQSGRRVFRTECGGTRIYNLRLIVFKSPQSVQVGDGLDNEILGRDIQRITKTEGRLMTDTIDISFDETYVSTPNAEFGEKPEKYIRLCDSEVGNIPGGWGTYIYMGFADNLPGASESRPYQTNLKDLSLCGGSGSTTIGRVITPITSKRDSTPAGQPDITITIENAFISGATFNAADAARYNFCQNLPDDQQTRQTPILPLTIKIQNVGTADIRTPFTVAINGGGNTNFFEDRVETVRSLQAGEIYQIIVQRKQSVVCGRKAGNNCTRCPDNFSGVRQWNDRGIRVTADNGGAITESNETNNTTNVP
jgi:hypothetical protein